LKAYAVAKTNKPSSAVASLLFSSQDIYLAGGKKREFRRDMLLSLRAENT
jgi:hypothetical protein